MRGCTSERSYCRGLKLIKPIRKLRYGVRFTPFPPPQHYLQTSHICVEQAHLKKFSLMCKYAFCFAHHFRVNCDNSLFSFIRATPFRPFSRRVRSPWFPFSILSSHHLSLILYVPVARNRILWGLDGIYGNLALLYSQLLSGLIISPVGPDSQSLPQPIRTLSAECKPQ